MNNFSGIEGYSTAHTSDTVYIIGGWYTKNTVAEFKDGAWRKLANLNQGRRGHGSISIGDETMIIGGENTGGK